MIRDLLDDLRQDPRRIQNPFSNDIEACHAVLFRAGASRLEMEDALNAWLAEQQPCRFGRMEAEQKRLSFCLLTENDLERGDGHVRATIQEDRDTWRQIARVCGSHGFIIVAISPQIAMASVGPELLRLARHLCSLYLDGLDKLDEQYHDSLLLAIRSGGATERREWKVGVNFFSAQGDGRWWRDHRFPGGIAYSMNSVGHMARQRAEEMLRKNTGLATQLADVPKDRLVHWALRFAMLTISPPREGSTRGTWLAERGQFEEDRELPPYDVRERMFRELVGYSENRYLGAYHTDQTIPSAYFDTSITNLADVKPRDDLFFTYLHNPQDEAYLTMGAGILAQAIEVEEEARHTERRET
jgi:hypothetical protein